MIIVIDSADVISEQGRLWEETMQDDSPGVENDPTAANVQDQAPSEIDIELMHDLQVLVDQLASRGGCACTQ